MSPSSDDDLLVLVDDKESSEAKAEVLFWNILIVDDDAQVHQATEIALRNIVILDRPLQLYHAHSASEGKQLLSLIPDIAVVLLDVVMETEHAGLDLVSTIRGEMGLRDLRIILRTGQPGYAPELEVIKQFDINDYRTKAELSQTRLITSLISSIRSYHQIRTIGASRRGLEMIIMAASDLSRMRNVEAFCAGVLTQIAGIIGLEPEGILCARKGHPTLHNQSESYFIISSAGRYAGLISHPLLDLPDTRIRGAVADCLEQEAHVYTDAYTVLFVGNADIKAAIYMETRRPVGPDDRHIVELFATNIATCLENVVLIESLQGQLQQK